MAFVSLVLTHNFGILKLTDIELHKLDSNMKKLYRKHRAQNFKSSIERFHLARKYGGKVIISLYTLHYKQIKNLRASFLEKMTDATFTPFNLGNEYDPLRKKYY